MSTKGLAAQRGLAGFPQPAPSPRAAARGIPSACQLASRRGLAAVANHLRRDSADFSAPMPKTAGDRFWLLQPRRCPRPREANCRAQSFGVPPLPRGDAKP